MKVVTYSQVHNVLKSILDEVVQDAEPSLVTAAQREIR